MRVVAPLLLVLAIAVASCTKAQVPLPAWFGSVQDALNHDCHAQWVGLYIMDTHGTEIQWRSKSQLTGDVPGSVAKVEHTRHGYRVIDCLMAHYYHG